MVCTSLFKKIGWSKDHQIKRKGDAHETLSLFFNRYGVIPKIVMYGSKEQTLGLFKNECQEAD